MTGLATMICDIGENIPRLHVRCRAQSGAIAVMPILDLSAGGLMVAVKGWAAMPGERVLATIDGFSALSGVLVWAEDGLAGIAFEVALHEAVLDQVHSKLEGTYLDATELVSQREDERVTTGSERRRFLV
ncbi:MAG: hypothetical protein B7Y88_00335 [Sphingomonadales bacterium 32-64-17]|nr:MAG: hypothetical protein B7Y88_00335 [Sphingomonadales bacterium 32-64-17]